MTREWQLVFSNGTSVSHWFFPDELLEWQERLIERYGKEEHLGWAIRIDRVHPGGLNQPQRGFRCKAIVGCERESVSRGYCRKHYAEWTRVWRFPRTRVMALGQLPHNYP